MTRKHFVGIVNDIVGVAAASCFIIFLAMWMMRWKAIGRLLGDYGKYSLIAMCFHLLELNTLPFARIVEVIGIAGRIETLITLFLIRVIWSATGIWLVLKILVLRKISGVR